MSDWMEQAWRHQLKQPDPRSCGPATLVVARMINDPAYAELMVAGSHPATGHTIEGSTFEERFQAEVLSMHKRVTGTTDVSGRLQLPWPQKFGTAPWAVARQMTGASGVRGTKYDPDLITRDRRDALAAILHATRNGHVTPVYVGSRWIPRHVVLVLDPDLQTYDPAVGRRVSVSSSDFLEAKLDLAGWSKPWFVVTPD